jgi:hypothetical protein
MRILSQFTIRWLGAMLLFGVLLFPLRISASDLVEEAAVGIGVTAGNLWFVPIKAIAVVSGMVAGGLTYVFFGGDAEMATQIWENTTQGPYLITPEVARAAVGKRPELQPD